MSRTNEFLFFTLIKPIRTIKINGDRNLTASHLRHINHHLVDIFTQSHVQMQLWFPLRGNRLCECSSLRHSLCSPQNQFDFTFQEWPSVPAAEPGQGGPRGIKKRGHRGSVSSESVFGKAPRESASAARQKEPPRAADHVPLARVTETTVNNRKRRK